MQLCIEIVDQHRNNQEIYCFYILSEKYKKICVLKSVVIVNLMHIFENCCSLRTMVQGQ